MAYLVRSDHAVPINGYGVCTNLQNHVSTTYDRELILITEVAKEYKVYIAQGRTI